MSVCVCVRARERESERARERRYARARAFAHTSGVRVYAVYTYIALRTRIGLEIYHHPEIANITNTQLTSLLYDTQSPCALPCYVRELCALDWKTATHIRSLIRVIPCVYLVRGSSDEFDLLLLEGHAVQHRLHAVARA